MRLKAIVAFLWLTPALAAAVSGESVYRQSCAGCHEQQSARIPHRTVLQRMPATQILRALDYGVMIAMGYPLTHAEREAVASYLGTSAAPAGPPAEAFCADRTIRAALDAQPQWNGWSPGAANARFQSADASMLTLDGVRRLKLKWAFAFDGDTTAFSQPTILGRDLFTGSAGGMIYALDRDTGCIHWTFDAKGPVRTSLVATRDGSSTILLFGDQNGWFSAVEAATGRLRWRKHVDEHDATRLTGSAVAANGIVYVPVASWEENRALKPDYPCCTARGSVVALRIHDGSTVWKTYMVGAPKLTGKNKGGVPQWGPSGAGIWSTPTLDTQRGLMYVTTGDNYSDPATDTSDAVVALETKTGRVVWSKQLFAGDIFNGRCSTGGRTDCGPDYDFGASAVLVPMAPKTMLLAGQKSGIVYALDPDRKGEVLWQTRVGKGGTNGGVLWGMAADSQKVYAAVSDLVRSNVTNRDAADLRSANLDPREGGGLSALRIADGTREWYTAGKPCDPPKPGCSPAQPAAVSAIPGAVFSGSIDGHLRAYSAEDGKVLWDFDTAQEFPTVNRAKGHGGSIDGPGAVVVGGMVFINSGYARQNGMPGNLLLAFAPGE